MFRFAFFITGILVSVVFAIAMSRAAVTECAGVLDAAASCNDTAQKTANYAAFKNGFNATLTALAAGDITLRAAVESVHALALEYHPEYLFYLTLSDDGRSERERLARNLVGHIRSVEEVCPNPQSRMLAIEAELCALLAELE